MNAREVRQNCRLYPTREQEKLLAQLFGASRVVYNTYLYSQEQAFKTQSGAKPLDLAHKGRAVEAGMHWLNDYSIAILQQARRDAEAAYKNYFRSLKSGRAGARVGRPKYRRKNARQSIRWSGQGSIQVKKLNRKWMAVRLPQPAGNKPQWLKFRASQPLHSEPTSVTIIRNSDKTYTVSFVTRQMINELRQVGATAGVDLGLSSLATYVDSDSQRYKIAPLKVYRAQEKKLARAQRVLARKKKGSKNREKAKQKVAKIHAKTARTRLDFNRKTALRLVGENQALGLETLAVKNLVKNKRLAKSISDAGWNQLATLIESTGQREGCKIIRADRYFPSSQVSACCSVLSGKKELAVREWQCDCGLVLDRDYNAATNLLLVAAGQAETLNDCGLGVRRELARATGNETVTSFQKLLQKLQERNHRPLGR